MNSALKTANFGTIDRSERQKFWRRLPVVRSLSQKTPPYHIGSVWENRCGLQVFRIVGKHVLRGLRRQPHAANIADFVAVLKRDGVLAIENFLPADEFLKVAEEFDEANRAVALQPYKMAENARLYRTQLAVGDAPENFPTIRRCFQENEFLSSLAGAVLKRRLTRVPDVLLDTYQMLNERGIDNDIENILHADLHVPTVKMFFYLSATDERNGAFVYAKGSHKLTLARLVHEYELSVREAKLKQGIKIPEDLLEARATQVRNIITPENRRRLKINESQLCVDANTLVVANNMGFHRRGEFSCGEPRRALLINYRKEERSFR